MINCYHSSRLKILRFLTTLLAYSFSFFFRYAKSVGAKHFHTSAKMNKGIDELFLDLTRSKFLIIMNVSSLFFSSFCGLSLLLLINCTVPWTAFFYAVSFVCCLQSYFLFCHLLSSFSSTTMGCLSC